LFRRTRVNAVKLFFIITDTPDRYARMFALKQSISSLVYCFFANAKSISGRLL
jgi:hypothetical protein